MSKNGKSVDPELPANTTAERFVLGAILGNGDLYSQTASLHPSDFLIDDNRAIYERMGDLVRRGDEITMSTVYLELEARKQHKSNTLTYMIELGQGIPELPSIAFYVNKVREAAMLRRLYHMGNKQMMCAATQVQTLAASIADARRVLDEIEERSQDREENELDQLPSAWRCEVDMQFLVEDLVLEGGITMLAGESGDGKSTLALAIAGAVAQGKPFLGRIVRQRPVLYLDRENPLFVVKDRLFQLGIPEIPDRLKIWGTWWLGHEPPAAHENVVINFAHKFKPLIVIDSLIAFARCDENSSQEMRRHMQTYRNLAVMGASLLIIHHRSDKGDSDYRGSSDIRASVDTAWILQRADGSNAGDALDQLAVRPFKTRGSPQKQLRIQYQNGRFVSMDGPRRLPADLIVELVLAYPGCSQKDLARVAAQHGIGKNSVPHHLEQLALSGKIAVKRGRSNSFHYYPPQPQLVATE